MSELDIAIRNNEIEETLLLCVSGFTNSEIADFEGMDVEDVDIYIRTYLDFEGWKERLDFNPWFMYNYRLDLTNPIMCGIINCNKLCDKFKEFRKEIYNEGD